MITIAEKIHFIDSMNYIYRIRINNKIERRKMELNDICTKEMNVNGCFFLPLFFRGRER